MRMMVRLVAATALLALSANTGAAQSVWPAVDPAYAYVPAPGCDRPKPGAPEACADQMTLFTAAQTAAAAANKSLLVVFGATWCPSCKSLKPALPAALSASGLGNRVHVVEITISTLDRGKVTGVPSGEAVRANLMRARPDFKQRAIPFVALIDAATGRTSARNLDDLEQSGAWNRKGLADVLARAETEATGGTAAPTEPIWLVRKWKRWFGG